MKFMTCWVVLLLVGCATGGPPPVPRSLPGPADAAEYAAFEGDGPLELRGQAFLTTRGGEVRVGAGQVVTLDPATTYARGWYQRFGGNVEDFGNVPSDPSFVAARRTTTADAEGRFAFPRILPGTYLLRTTVTWEAGGVPQGGVVGQVVQITEGENEEVILAEVYTTGYAATLGVPIVGEAELSARRFRVISEVRGESCRPGLIQADPSEAAAREDIVIEAARLPDADAVARVACRTAGLSWSCTSRVICDGIAIAWTS